MDLLEQGQVDWLPGKNQVVGAEEVGAEDPVHQGQWRNWEATGFVVCCCWMPIVQEESGYHRLGARLVTLTSQPICQN